MTNVDIYEECVGQIGRWQIYKIFLLAIMRFTVAWHQLSIVFLAPVPEFECSVPNVDKCSVSCPSHIFKLDKSLETVVTKWDLVCDNFYLVSLMQSLSMIGMLFGSLGVGFLSDIYGRKYPLLISNVVLIISGIGCAFTPWLWLFVTLKFITGLAIGGITLNTFVLAMELIGKSYRTSVGALFHVPFFLGYSFLGLLGYYIRNWQYLQFTISIISVLFLCYFWLIPESPRWLLISDNVDRSIKIMQKAAKVNRIPSYGVQEKVNNHLQTKTKDESNKAAYFLDLFRTKNMRIRTISLVSIYFCIFFVYYGTSQYLGEIGNPYLNIAISGLVQVPGTFICIYLMNKIGRKRTFIVGNLLSSVACFLILAVPEDTNWGYTVLGCLGILFNGIATNANYILSGELFPTVVRSLGMGTCYTFAKIGSAIAPFVIVMKINYAWVPPVVLGVLPIFACLFCFKLPETLNQKMPDTIEEVEDFDYKDKKIIHVMQ